MKTELDNMVHAILERSMELSKHELHESLMRIREHAFYDAHRYPKVEILLGMLDERAIEDVQQWDLPPFDTIPSWVKRCCFQRVTKLLMAINEDGLDKMAAIVASEIPSFSVLELLFFVEELPEECRRYPAIRGAILKRDASVLAVLEA